MSAPTLGSRWQAKQPADAGAYAHVTICGSVDGEVAIRSLTENAPIIQADPALLAEAYDLIFDPRSEPARLVSDGGNELAAWSPEVRP